MLPLGLWYLSSQRAFLEQRCIQMTFPPTPGQWPWWDSLHVRLDPSIADTTFYCAGRLENSIDVLEEFRLRAADLAARNDTNTWLHVRFEPDVKYATVMHAIESCRRHLPVWSLDNGSLVARYYIRRPDPPHNTYNLFGGCIVYDDVIEAPSNPEEDVMSWLRGVWDEHGSLAVSLWPVHVVFMLLAILSIKHNFRLRLPANTKALP